MGFSRSSPLATLCSVDVGSPCPKRPAFLILLMTTIVVVLQWDMIGNDLLLAANIGLPGKDMSGQLEAAGTLLRLIDTLAFKWVSRILAGICVISGALALKEQRFGLMTLCAVGAFIISSTPKWVANLFEIGGNESLFSMLNSLSRSIGIG